MRSKREGPLFRLCMTQKIQPKFTSLRVPKKGSDTFFFFDRGSGTLRLELERVLKAWIEMH